jgi:hypothetical protein
MQHEPEDTGESFAPESFAPESFAPESFARWPDVHTVGDFVGYLAAYDPHNICAHGRQWTRCWSCGHYEDHLDDVDTFNDSVD